MKHNLKTLKKLFEEISYGYVTDAEIELDALIEELQQLFDKEEQIAEDNQDLYYLDKVQELRREILGENKQ